MKKKPTLLFGTLLFMFLFWKQQPAKEKAKPMTSQELVQQKLKEKIDIYKSQKIKNCRKDAYKKAAQQVDSMLIARAKSERKQEIQRPPKPNKPNRPDLLVPKDTSVVKPLIQ